MATLSREQLQWLQQNGRLDGNQLAGVVSDPGAYGGLVPTERINSYGWRTVGDNEGSPVDRYDRPTMEWAARQLGVDPNGMDDAQLYQALQTVNATPGQYTLTQDAAQMGDAQTRARQNFTLDADGNLVPVGNQQLLDMNPNSDWRSMGQPLATYLAGIGTLGAASAAGVGAGAAGGAASGAGSGAGEFAAWQAADMAGTGAAAGGGGAALGAAAPVAGGAAMGGGGGAAAGGAGLLGTLGQAAGALNSPLGAAALGALAGAAGSGPQTTSSSQSLPDWLQPYAQPYAQRTMALADKPFEAYTGQGVAGLTPDQIQAAQMIRNTVGQANPLGDASQAQMLSTINGQYLDPASNPYLQSTFDQAAKRMTDAYNASSARSNAAFHDAGSFGSSGHQALVESNNRAFGDSLANLSNQIYGQNYQQERARQAQAMQYSPQFSGQMQSNTLRGADALNAAGAQARDVNQQGLNFDYQQFMRQQDYPYKQLDTMASLFNPNLGRNSTQTQPGVSQTAGLLGGAAAGLGLYRQYNGLLGQPTTSTQPSGPSNAELARMYGYQ